MTNEEHRERPATAASDADLETVQAAWRRLPPEEPPDLVDQAVLSRARRDLERSRPRRLRWIGHFATAGVVVIAVSILLLQDWGPPVGGDGEALRLERSAQPEAASPRDKGASDRAAAPAVVAEEPAPPAAAALQEEMRAGVAARREAAAEPPISAEAWVEELLRLQAEGRAEELAAGLEAFRAAYPDYPLPPALGAD